MKLDLNALIKRSPQSRAFWDCMLRFSGAYVLNSARHSLHAYIGFPAYYLLYRFDLFNPSAPVVVNMAKERRRREIEEQLMIEEGEAPSGDDIVREKPRKRQRI
jgi:hypothetical protein